MKIKLPCSVIATGHKAVTQAAATLLANGGNAFDAAVAAGFAGAVAEQTLTSLGGGGFLLARTAEHKEIFFDFFVDTPGLGLDTKTIDPHFYPVKINFGGSTQEFNIGLGSVAVPGTLKGLLHVHERLGQLPLSEVLNPAIELARGHVLNAFQAGFLEMLHPILTMTATGRAIYEPEGQYVQHGDVLAMPALVDFLHQIIDDQGANFYRGDLARQIEREMRQQGGLLTSQDLASYRVIERKPLHVPYRGYTLLTGPPPSLGGSLIALSLALLEKMSPSKEWGTGEYMCRTLALMREVEQLREQGIVTPAALEAFKAGKTLDTSVESIRLFSRGTTHVSIADTEGNIASMTCSNGEGSGYFAPGTGIMLNNMMGEDDLHPDGFHSAPAGQRVGSMMSPSALLADNEVQLVFGSGGSKRIRTALTQVLCQFVDYNRDLDTAINAPRMHWDGETLQVEPGFTNKAVKSVANLVPVNVWDELSVYFGGVHSVIPGKSGTGDPRRGGSVAVVTP